MEDTLFKIKEMVECLTTGVKYESLRQLACEIGINDSYICALLKKSTTITIRKIKYKRI